jgi:hypothetical protein
MRMKRIVFAAILLAPVFSRAQSNFMTEGNDFLKDINGNPIFIKSTYTAEGTPFYSDQYCTANIKVLNGKRYRDMPIKLNLLENRVIYQTPNGGEMEALTQIESIRFGACEGKNSSVLFRSGYPLTGQLTERTYYQVLDSGTVQLLKYWKINYTDQKPYSSAVTIRKFEVKPEYYAYMPEKGMIKLEKGNENALDIISEKKTKASQFVNEQHLKLRKEDDLVKLFYFLNAQ